MPLHAELQTFFDSHAAKTCDCRRAAHDQLAPVLAAVQDIRAHLNDLEAKLEQAELAAHDQVLDNTMGWMHTRLDAAKQRCEGVRREIRDLAKSLVEVEQCFDQGVIDTNLVLVAHGKDGTIAIATPVAPSVP
jgi:hypothetical protein